jgi:anti-anti-sigma factor
VASQRHRSAVIWSAPVGLRLGHVGHEAPIPVVFLEGEYDMETVPEIDRFLRQTYGPFYHRRHQVFDMRGVTFIDSSFVGFVVALTRRLRAEGRELILTRPTGAVRRVLTLVGVPNLVPVYDSLDDAVSAVAYDRLPAIPPALEPLRPTAS